MSIGILLGQGGSGSIPAGLICMWSESSSNIPSGWALCNGSNNTPDLRNKFVLGAGKDYAVGATGGEKEVALTVAQMPRHNHTIYLGYEFQGGSSGTLSYSPEGRNSATERTNTTGGGESHNNMPPYYALCFIIKL